MLGKLLKHEFRATGRVMLPVLGVLLVLALLFNISIRYIDTVDSNLLRVMFGLIIFVFFVGVIAAALIAVVLMVNRFYKNLLGDEGYLMFTLPTDVHALVWSKLIVSFVWFFVTALIIFLIIFGTTFSFNATELREFFYGFPSWAEIREALAEIGLSVGDLALLGVEYLLILIVSGLTVCLHFYAAMALGHSFANHKVLYSILFFIAISLVFQFLSLFLGVASIESFDGLHIGYYQTAADSVNSVKLMFAYILGGELLQGGILYAITTLSLKKRLNLA